ncbi:hypothetical protein BDZ97DRAFT_1767901 [Flammula alnicola]|nr:hypothetical protein BDZ97DRAFT_1767901 [Flammula alnicola]
MDNNNAAILAMLKDRPSWIAYDSDTRYQRHQAEITHTTNDSPCSHFASFDYKRLNLNLSVRKALEARDTRKWGAMTVTGIISEGCIIGIVIVLKSNLQSRNENHGVESRRTLTGASRTLAQPPNIPTDRAWKR